MSLNSKKIVHLAVILVAIGSYGNGLAIQAPPKPSEPSTVVKTLDHYDQRFNEQPDSKHDADGPTNRRYDHRGLGPIPSECQICRTATRGTNHHSRIETLQF